MLPKLYEMSETILSESKYVSPTFDLNLISILSN